MNYYRSIWISDVHLGTKGCQAKALLDFLKQNESQNLFIVGDLIDIWALRRGIYWPQEHSDVLQKILRKGRKGTRIIYITGNHDEFFEDFHGAYASVSIQQNALHITADGKRILVIHGHELDTVVQNMGWLAHVGDIGYSLLIRCNRIVNRVRRWFGLGYWSLSAYVKAGVKNVVSFIGKFEEAIVRYAAEYEVDAVLCGHIHTPSHRVISGIQYWNTGDWVESCSAVVEHFDGRMELIRWFQPIHGKQTEVSELAEATNSNQTSRSESEAFEGVNVDSVAVAESKRPSSPPSVISRSASNSFLQPLDK